MERIEVAGLKVAGVLHDFVVREALPGTGVDAQGFWTGLAGLVRDLGPKNRSLLDARDALQAKIDDYHRARTGRPLDEGEYERFLRDIAYLAPEPGDFSISTANVDEEIATIAGPQLVVPVSNARYALNAANARWGSLYDALYGTDAIGSLPPPGGYDRARGAEVIAWVRRFLDDVVPLEHGSHSEVVAYSLASG